jgi:Fe-Mn family superoxide dismutase
MKTTPSLDARVTRRDALKVIGLSAALAGLDPLRLAAQSADAAVDRWSLPKLSYGYGALEPHLDARTMEIHHSKHHQAYITAAKKAAEPYPEILSMSPEQVVARLPALRVPDDVRTVLRNQVGGHVNHTFFWQIIAPGGGTPTEALTKGIQQTFGSVEELKQLFNDAAVKRFGSGWAWLSVKEGKLVVHSTPNQDSPLADGATPIIGVDVWEHAYYLKYQNLRADYLKAFWNLVNWTQAGKHYALAMG